MKFYPNDGRPAITISSIDDIVNYMGGIMYDFGPVEIQDGLVLTQIHGHYVVIGEVRPA